MTILATNKNIRSANRHFFEESGIREGKGARHHPYLVFKKYSDRLNLEVVEDPKKLLDLPARTKVITQWQGKKRSDFFGFTVGQLKKHVEENPRSGRQKI